MTRRDRIRIWLGRHRPAVAAEDGYIIVVAMVLLVIGLAVGAAVLTETIGSRDHGVHDERSARALQAADAGVQSELYRVNQTDLKALNLTQGLSLSSIVQNLLVCPIPTINASGQVSGLSFAAVTQVGNPCPTNSSSGISGTPLANEEPVGQHSYFETQYIPGLTSIGDFIQFNPKIVSSGVDDNGSTQVSRRVEAILAPFSPWRTLEAGHDLTFDVPSALGVSLAGVPINAAGATVFNGTAAANHDINLVGQGGVVNAFTGANISLSGGLTEPSTLDYCNDFKKTNITLSLVLGRPTQACSTVNRSAIQVSASKQDCVLASGVNESCGSDSGFGNSYDATRDAIYNANSSTTITFQPGDYVFCSVQTNGPVSVNPSSTQAVRIFIDNPNSSRCKNFQGYTSVPSGFKTTLGNFTATQGVGWSSLSGTLSTTHPSQAQIYVAGNGTNDGTAVYSTGSTLLSGQSMFLYAPSSNVTVSAGEKCSTLLGQTLCTTIGTLAGAFIGWDLTVSATAVTQDLGLLNYPLSTTLGPFYVKQYIECTPEYPLPSPDPTSGC